jgi:hypothetical protein
MHGVHCVLVHMPVLVTDAGVVSGEHSTDVDALTQ